MSAKWAAGRRDYSTDNQAVPTSIYQEFIIIQNEDWRPEHESNVLPTP